MPTILTNKSPMPFGRYKGWPMGQVPAKYLMFVWQDLYKGICHETSPAICRYIHDNLEELKKNQFLSRPGLRY